MNVLRLVRISFCICDWLLRNLSFLPIKKTCTLQFFPCKNSDLFLTSPDKTNERELFFTKCIKLCSIFFQFEGNYKCHFIFGCFGEIPYLWQLYTIQRQKNVLRKARRTKKQLNVIANIPMMALASFCTIGNQYLCLRRSFLALQNHHCCFCCCPITSIK